MVVIVVRVFERGAIRFDDDLLENSKMMRETLVKMGTSLGTALGTALEGAA